MVLCEGVDWCNWLLKEVVGAKILHHFWESGQINGLPLSRQNPHQEVTELEMAGDGSKMYVYK